MPLWWNWQTHSTQNAADNIHVGSSPTNGTTFKNFYYLTIYVRYFQIEMKTRTLHFYFFANYLYLMQKLFHLPSFALNCNLNVHIYLQQQKNQNVPSILELISFEHHQIIINLHKNVLNHEIVYVLNYSFDID